MLSLILILFVTAPTFASEGLATPDSLKAKWGEVKNEAIEKYEKVKTSDFGEKVQRKAVQAKNSNFVKGVFANAGVLWQKALLKGKNLLSRADQKLHETILSNP